MFWCQLKVGYSKKNIGIIYIAQKIFKLKFSKFVQDISTLKSFDRFLLRVKVFKTPGFHTIFNSNLSTKTLKTHWKECQYI